MVQAAVLLGLLILRLRPFLLTVACQQQSVVAAHLLLAMGTDPNFGADDPLHDFATALRGPHTQSVDNPWRCPLLVIAARNRQVVMLKLLLDYGADVNATDDGRFTPLCEAQSNDDTASIQLLLARGTDPGIGCGKG
jgi:ankyrin repeat protein